MGQELCSPAWNLADTGETGGVQTFEVLLPFEAGYICPLPKTEMEPGKEGALSPSH